MPARAALRALLDGSWVDGSIGVSTHTATTSAFAASEGSRLAQAVLRDLLLEKTLKTRLVTPKRALTHVDRVDFPGVDVDAHDARARRGDRGRERHPDIAEADYADLHERAHVAGFG